MDKLIDKQIVNTLLKHQSDQDFDIDEFNNELPALRNRIRRDLKNQLVKNQDQYETLQNQIQNNLADQLSIMKIYLKFSDLFSSKQPPKLLKMIRKYLYSYTELYQYEKILDESPELIDSKNFKTYGDIERFYNLNKTHDNLEKFENIIDYLEKVLENPDRKLQSLLDLIYSILESNDSEDISFLQELSEIF